MVHFGNRVPWSFRLSINHFIQYYQTVWSLEVRITELALYLIGNCVM